MKKLILLLGMTLAAFAAHAQNGRTVEKAPAATEAGAPCKQCNTPAAEGMVSQGTNKCSPEVANNNVPGLNDKGNQDLHSFCQESDRTKSGGEGNAKKGSN